MTGTGRQIGDPGPVATTHEHLCDGDLPIPYLGVKSCVAYDRVQSTKYDGTVRIYESDGEKKETDRTNTIGNSALRRTKAREFVLVPSK